MNPRARDTLFVAGAACAWGLWSLILRPTGLPSTTTSPLIFVMMAAWTLPFTWREPRVTWTRRMVWLLVGNVVCDGVNVLTFFAALDRTTVAIAVVTHYAAPVIVAVAAPRIDGVRVPHAVPAALVALAGLALMLEPWHGATGWTGAALGLTSAVAYAGNVFVVRRLTTHIGPTRSMAYHSIGSAILLLPFAIGGFAAVEIRDLGLLAVGTATLGALAGVAYLRGLAGIGATRAALLTFCEPLVAVVVGTLVWGEPLRAPALAGAVLVIGAGVAVARSSS